MDKMVLFCKSYDKDLYRAKRLADSVDRYNISEIPFYISVPETDLAAFQQVMKENRCILITDENIIKESCKVFGDVPGFFASHLMQQLIKLEFWRMEKAENYAWVDSDSYFIKEFHITDFMYDRDTPYTIMELFDVTEKELLWHKAPQNERERRINDRIRHIDHFRCLFEEEVQKYNFGVSTPIIWSAKVLKHFYEHYLVPRNKSIFRMLADHPCETFLYGYYLLHSQCIPIHPQKHMFKAFDYLDEFVDSQIKGENEYSLSKAYFGICIQSNWAFFREKKTISQRLGNRKQEFLNYISKVTR